VILPDVCALIEVEVTLGASEDALSVEDEPLVGSAVLVEVLCDDVIGALEVGEASALEVIGVPGVDVVLSVFGGAVVSASGDEGDQEEEADEVKRVLHGEELLNNVKRTRQSW
jgi:hypothetical protein